MTLTLPDHCAAAATTNSVMRMRIIVMMMAMIYWPTPQKSGLPTFDSAASHCSRQQMTYQRKKKHIYVIVLQKKYDKCKERRKKEQKTSTAKEKTLTFKHTIH